MEQLFKQQSKADLCLYLDLVGNRLSELRRQQHKSLTTVSKATGIPRRTIRKMEKGRLNFKIFLLLRLCHYYDTTLCFIFQHRETVIDELP